MERFRNISRIAPKILDVIVATLANQLSGLGVQLRRSLKKPRASRLSRKAGLRLMNKLGIRSVGLRHKHDRRRADWMTSYILQPVGSGLPRFSTEPEMGHRHHPGLYPHGKLYLSAIKDLYDDFIVAYHTSLNNLVELVIHMLLIAKEKEVVSDGLALRSDHGDQYCSQPYYLLLQQQNLITSVSRRGNCLDNAPIGNFFSHLKEEALRQYKTPTFQEANQIIDDYICFYNYEMIQLKTEKTPYQLRCLSG